MPREAVCTLCRYMRFSYDAMILPVAVFRGRRMNNFCRINVTIAIGIN